MDEESREEKDGLISVKRWIWFTKWSRKLLPEVRRGILKERSMIFKEVDERVWRHQSNE